MGVSAKQDNVNQTRQLARLLLSVQVPENRKNMSPWVQGHPPCGGSGPVLVKRKYHCRERDAVPRTAQPKHTDMKTLSQLTKRTAIFAAVIPGVLSITPLAEGAVLTTGSFSISSSGGSGGAGASTSDMIYQTFQTSDGWGWAGGAGGVQGSGAVTNAGGASSPANETFKFKGVGASVDTWNRNYGVGNWAISNVQLTFYSSYSVQNNSRFGRGSGTFDIYWVANDNWAQTKGTSTDRQLNPIYASSGPDLLAWSGSQALLGSKTFTLGASGYVGLTFSLDAQTAFLNDIYSASAAGNPSVSLYLMATSDTLGMIIFTGGQSQPLPTMTFDVVSVPEPGVSGLIGIAGALHAIHFSRKRTGKPARRS